eukprot:TRINITY_DN23540_c0_g1_i1.p1 TRINITY_DN23540_c0_g1~~TRINITY_DN23540_c0_g1_i1.p1  ORF type:complete len:171 (+),score=7.97 TRINITY_DN23540_c0_g1_i1:112-624(+)
MFCFCKRQRSTRNIHYPLRRQRQMCIRDSMGAAYDNVVSESNKKGPVLQTAVIAAIMGVKQTSTLIPMCHPLTLSGINCDVDELPELPGFKLTVTAKLTGQTGVEMEALTGTSIGLLTIYDMVKAIDKGMIISHVQLEEKSGGINGDYKRQKRQARTQLPLFMGIQAYSR